MKEVLVHWEEFKKLILFECKHCWCIFKSNEYYIEYEIYKDTCPECRSKDVFYLLINNNENKLIKHTRVTK